jgi:hypothetical protein
MKSILLFFLLVSISVQAQVWAPSGATWYYDWAEMETNGYAKVQYVKDSLVGGTMCKVLRIEQHTYNWMSGTYTNTIIGHEFTYSENNIVYYYRYGQFFKLYDFSAIAGSSWVVAGWNQANPCDSTGSVVVDSTGTMTINAYPLKYLKNSPGQGSEWIFTDKVVERIGGMGYMFPEPVCLTDFPGPVMLRCYSDDQFGLYKRPGFPPTCDYITGIESDRYRYDDVKIYPVPASSEITVELGMPGWNKVMIEISDMLGYRIKTFESDNAKLCIDIEDLHLGIYFITISTHDGLFRRLKFVKTLP